MKYSFLDRWPVKIICVTLAIVLYSLFRVNTLTERQITVPLTVRLPEGFVVSSEYPGNINVTLRGENDDVQSVLTGDVEAFINLSEYQSSGEYQMPVEFRKTGTALQPEALEFRARPGDIALSIEPRQVRSLVVQPEISGFPALGYELTQYFVSPSSVTVVGPESQMEELTELKTELIDLSGRRSDFTMTSRIVPPSPLLSIPGGQIVEFRAVVDEAVIIRTLGERELVILDLPDGLQIDGELPTVSLTVQGNQLTVEGSRPQDMTFYIDGSSIVRPGQYVLPVRLDIPPGLAVLQLLPREVTVGIVPAAGGTP